MTEGHEKDSAKQETLGSMKDELKFVLGRVSIIIAACFLLLFAACGVPLLAPQAIEHTLRYTIPNIPQNIEKLIKGVYGDIVMPDYQTEKFKWGVANTTSHPLGSRNTIGAADGENWMKDAQGNVVARWVLAGDAWGAGSTAIPGGAAAVGRLPQAVRLTYYDYADGHFYRLDAELPQKKMYELFKQKTTTKDSGSFAIDVAPRYFDIKYGIGPKGFVVLWLSGIDQIEVATFQAQVMPDMTIEKYNQGNGGEQPAIQLLGRWEGLVDKGMSPDTIAKLKSGWSPSADYYKNLRIKYPWRFEMTGNARMNEYEGYFANKEYKTVFQYEMAQDKVQLKAVPERAGLYFTDKTGQRYYLEFKFYDSSADQGEFDLSKIQKAFESLYPNRTAADNDQTVPESEFARIEVKVGDDVTQIQADLVKGEKRIPLHLYYVGYKPLPPHQFDERGPKPTKEQIKLLEFGPQSKINLKVKIGEVCPQTGYWSCEYLSSKDGLFMRAGDRMPGQSAVARGDVSADTLWTLVKPEG